MMVEVHKIRKECLNAVFFQSRNIGISLLFGLKIWDSILFGLPVGSSQVGKSEKKGNVW